jgi:hypothetical protein
MTKPIEGGGFIADAPPFPEVAPRNVPPADLRPPPQATSVLDDLYQARQYLDRAIRKVEGL